MHILHLISGRGPTGPAAAALADVKALRAAGHTATIATRDGTGLMDACAAENVPAIGGLRLGKGPMRLLRLPHDMRRLRAIMRELSIDTVHVHRSDDQLLAAAAIGRTLSARLIRTWHRSPETESWLLLSRLARQVDGCVCVSRDAVVVLQKAEAHHSVFIPVGVDTAIFSPAPSTVENDVPLIGQAGRWKRDRHGRDRGQRAALDVFAQLIHIPQAPQWQGVLIGRGEMGETLRREAYAERGMPEERIKILNVPAQSPHNFAAILGTLSLGLVFNTGGDGTSRAAAEMLACGVPLIVADLPGLREFADDPSCVKRQLPRDACGWARQLEVLLQDAAALKLMRIAARARAEKVHALKVRGLALAEFYASV